MNDANHMERIALAAEAAELLFYDDDPNAVASYEPNNYEEANAAIRRLGELFDKLPGKITRALEGASESGSLLSSDRLQGLAEIVQNADDAGASQIRLLLRPTDLLICHDGEPVRLHNVLGFAIPWLSTKGGEAATTGRFGIGLMALRSLSTTIEVHCPPYHFQIGQPTISPIDQTTLPALFQEKGCTTLLIPLEQGAVNGSDIDAWLRQWDDASLIFLRQVSRVTLFSIENAPIRELAVSRFDDGDLVIGESAERRIVSRELVESSDGRSWSVYSDNVPSPSAVSRARKATKATTPLSVAFPLQTINTGVVYSGLPVTPARMALFANAQFDPLTSRLGFADTEWNRALIPSVAELWAQGALDFFQRHPKVAWYAMPVLEDPDERTESWLVQSLEEEITERASQWLASKLSFQVPERGNIHLAQLAFEVQPLELILAEDEVAKLADLSATLPSHVRDQAGRWRAVLNSWRLAGANLPEPVSVARALELLFDESRPVDSTIDLIAAALDDNLKEQLLVLPCVIAHDGRRLVPPSADSPEAIVAESSQLAQQMGVVTLLHDAHLQDNSAASEVLKWLKECGALLDGTDDRAILYRLASAGRSGRRLENPLTDEQAMALRDAFELLDPNERQELGPNVGRAILLEAFMFDGKRRRSVGVRPMEAYLPRNIDREPDSFALAAGQAPGLVWLSTTYAQILRSSIGRQGVGAQRFLRLLGAEIAPRLRLHRGLERRFSDPRLGLKKSISQGPESRQRAMEERGATYTLQDNDSPDLLTVARDISRERRNTLRRRRASALLASLHRAWERHLGDLAEVESASDYFQWQLKGQIPAYWVWQVGDVPWLDDEGGTPRRPVELRVRTPGNVAIYGDDSPDYLHKDLYQPNLRAVLSAIGVSGDPTRSEFVDRLKRIRDGAEGEGERLLGANLRQEVAVIYKALAHDLQLTTSRSALSATQLRQEFQRGAGLVLTNLGWLPPRAVLAGTQIFGDYAPFALRVDGTEPLWRALNLREPSPDDCLKVIHKIARKPHGPNEKDETILLETLRALASHLTLGNTVPPRRLRELALWTTKGWLRKRPVYATDDAVLAIGLRDRFPLWEPGGELEQFQSLLGPLSIEEIRVSDVEVIAPELSEEDSEATELFRRALSLLEEDLARNDPQLAASIRVPWGTVGGFNVRVHPSLSLAVHLFADRIGEEFTTDIDAKVDNNQSILFIRHLSVLPRVDGAGRALASLFSGNSRRLAQAWRAAFDRAEEGLEAHRIELAQQRDERERAHIEQEVASRYSALQNKTASNRGGSGGPVPTATASNTDIADRNGGRKAADLGQPRTLVDPNSLTILDRRGRIEKGTDVTPQRRNRGGGLAEPSNDSKAPQNRIAIPGYSAVDRETVGMDLVRMLLNTDYDEIVDLRAQRGVGADAIDSMKAFYELKVSAGTEPDHVTLTSAEVQRAMNTPNYFLIVVSGVEGVDARPKLRVFVDPLKQLKQTYTGPLTLSGVRTAESLVYDFAPMDDAAATGGKEGQSAAEAS